MEGGEIRQGALLPAADTFSGRSGSETTVAVEEAWHGSSGMQAKTSMDVTHPSTCPFPKLCIVTMLQAP